jgi:hypothetical protein
LAKVLCKGCSFPVGPITARCPRCGKRWPYFTSRRKRKEAPGSGPSFAVGKDCPVCGTRTRRQHAPAYLKPLRWVLPHRFTYRRCESCGWKGGAFHPPSDHSHTRRSRSHGSRHPVRETPGD